MPAEPTTSDRPDPIGSAVASVGSAVSALLGVAAFLVQVGFLTPDQQTAINEAGQVIVSQTSPVSAAASGLFVAVSGVLASFAAGKTAKKKVTPVEDPRDNDGRVLSPVGQ